VEQFGERLRRLRGDRPQKSVAEALDIPQTTLSSLEKQVSVPRGDILTKLADFFRVSVEYFYDEPEIQSSESAKLWLQKLRANLKGRETIATHAKDPLDPKVREKIAAIIKAKYEETSNKKR
jgi:transcriptional regulator with XRE-family HTH domain